MSDLIDKDALLNSIYSDNPTDIMLYIAEFPTAETIEEKILVAGYEGKEIRFRMHGRLFAVRELAQ